MKISKVSGPPGTGKTTFLMRQIENAARKYDPGRIGAISFTKAAVEEMRSRVKNLGYSSGSSKNIRTLHSHSYRLLGLSKSQIVDKNTTHINAWNQSFPKWSLPGALNLEGLEDESVFGSEEMNENSRAFNAMQILRNRCIPVESWTKVITDIGERAQHFYRDWIPFLEENELWDFTRILEECTRLRFSPEIDVLFIDESQDLSKLQLNLTAIWGANCEQVIYIGDADQAIYVFAGSSPEDFRDLQHEWATVLGQSYRVPKAVHAYASRMISKIKGREQVVYQPTDQPGRVVEKFYPDLDLPGSHMILTRCNYHLNRWKKWLIEKGIVWHNPYRPKTKDWNPSDTKTWKAVQTYDRIHRGLEVTGEDLREMIAKISASYMVRGVKTHRKKTVDTTLGPHGLADVFYLSSSGWFEPSFFNFSDPISKIFSLSGNSGKLIEFHGEAITRKDPKCIIGTIHSVKGGQSSNVWVDRSTSMSIGRACMDSSAALDDERRVSYVAATRSSNVLGLLYPQGPGSMAFV